MDEVLSKYKIIQTIAYPNNAFVERYPDPTNINSIDKQSKFLNRIRNRIFSILVKLKIHVHLFLVREYSENIDNATEMNRVFMHSHILIFIPKEKYSDELLDELIFFDYKTETRIYKFTNTIDKNKQDIDNVTSLTNFINYLLKDITKDSISPIDYQYVDCPLEDYINQQISLKTTISPACSRVSTH